MKDPNVKTRVVHSQTKPAWNVVGVSPLGGKYKIARVPYVVISDDKIDEINRVEAYGHAEFISHCFNNSDKILQKTEPPPPEVKQPSGEIRY